MHLPGRRALTAWLALLAVVGLAASVAVWQLRASRALVEHTYEVLDQTGDLLEAVLDAETGQRGYLLTGEEPYLAPYDAARRRLDAVLARLRGLVADNPAQTARLPAIRELLDARLAALERGVALRREGRAEEALALVRGGEGKRSMDALRAELAALEGAERGLLEERSRRAERYGLAAGATALLASALSLALGLVAAAGLARQAREARAVVRSTAANAPVGFSFVDTRLRYLDINPALAAVNGVPVEAHLGRTVAEVLPDLWPALEPVYRAVIEEGRTVADLELRAAVPSDPGRERDWLLTYYPVKDEAGRVLGAGAVVLDITARKDAERALRDLAATLERRVEERTRELQEANEELDAFAYTISHDLRAPLRAMEGFARILLDDYAAALDDDGRRYARRIVDAAARMEALIQDLLAYSRLSRAEVELRPTDLDGAVGQALAALREGDAGRRARVEVAGRPLPRVLANATVLGQALANLLANAAKFVPPGADPEIRVAAETREGGRRVRLWVEDRGIGVAPEHRERVFRVFERLHGQEAYPGTGIGLAIVRKAAERMGGAAGLEPGPGGRGSRFWIELDAAGAPAAAVGPGEGP
jgi:PAS domain S-box-containing protein